MYVAAINKKFQKNPYTKGKLFQSKEEKSFNKRAKAVKTNHTNKSSLDT